MARPNRGTDRALLKAGKQILLSRGAKDLSVNAVCRIAGVNVGMFVYNFKSKEAFMNCLMEEIYREEFSVEFESGEEGKNSPADLENMLLIPAILAAKYPILMREILADTFNGDASFIAPLRQGFGCYIGKLLKLLEVCQNRQEITRQLTIPEVLLSILPAVIEPSLNGRALLRHLRERQPEITAETMLGSERILHRIRFILKRFRE